uniref:Uncharacterized protein n=1 Tax=Poecilia mexicana TaxID=48701 RepID=A0A3B3YLM0_9TELE
MRLRNVSVLTVLLFGLSGLVSLSWYTAFSTSRGKPGSAWVSMSGLAKLLLVNPSSTGPTFGLLLNRIQCKR